MIPIRISHVFAGKVYSFGRGKRGQTGRGNTEDVWSPAEIPSLAGMRIKKIVGGEDFTVVVTGKYYRYASVLSQDVLTQIHSRTTQCYLHFWKCE